MGEIQFLDSPRAAEIGEASSQPASGLIAASSLLAKLSAPVERRPKGPSGFDRECFWLRLCNRCRFAFAVVVLPGTAHLVVRA
jgi:hypothetical protein